MHLVYSIPSTEKISSSEETTLLEELRKLKGVLEADWQAVGKRFILHVSDPDHFQLALQKLIRLGISIETQEGSFPVSGMTCAGCVNSVQTLLEDTPGVVAADVNLATNTTHIKWIESIVDPEKMKDSVKRGGYDLIYSQGIEDAEEDWKQLQESAYQRTRRQMIYSAILTVPIVIIAMVFHKMPYANWIMIVLSTPVVFWFGRRFIIGAWKQLRMGKANMDTLVALSTSIAYLFSAFNTIYPSYFTSRGLEAHVYFEAAAVIITFILLGKWLESRAKARTSSAIEKLMVLQPDEVRIIDEDGNEQMVRLETVQPGQRVVVKPGEHIPVDGLVIEGNSYVDEGMITGESVPIERQKGDRVIAGTINQLGRLVLRAEQIGAGTLLSRIIGRVRQAQGSRAPVQGLVDRIAGVFVPIVIAIAVVTFVIWQFSQVENAFTYGLVTMITVLVIACPCALGLATPTAIMVGIGKGAEQGILIRDAESLEQARDLDVIVLDKTGTITRGEPAVQDVMEVAEDLDWGILSAIERASEHPLGEAIVRYFDAKVRDGVVLESFESVTGKGVRAVVDGENFFAGNERWIREREVQITDKAESWAKMQEDKAASVIYFSDERRLLGMVVIADTIKETSVEAIRTMQDMGLEVHMLTGDHPATAAAIAREVGIEHWKAGVLPDEKAAFIRELKSQGKKVGMVGDGINDSEALALADVGIAMGQGADIAMEVAKMTLMSSDLNQIPRAIQLSRRTVKTIRQNLFWAFVYNVVGIPIAAGLLFPFTGFLLNPMIAGAAMALSSVSVVTNSLRLR
jgi:P-type Cu2+ transporter